MSTNFDLFLYQFSVKGLTGDKTVYVELVDEGNKAQYCKEFDEYLEQERERLKEIE